MEALDLYTGQNKTGTHYRWLIGTVVHPSTGTNVDAPNNQYYKGLANPSTSYGTNIFNFIEGLYGTTPSSLTLYTESNDYITIDYHPEYTEPYLAIYFDRARQTQGVSKNNFGFYLATVKNSPVLQAFKVVTLIRNWVSGELGYEFTNYSKELIAIADLGDYDPYSQGGYSTVGGGDPQKQNWSENSDIVLPSPLPDENNYGAVSCGLITIFSPTKAQLQKLSEVLWGQGFWNFVQNAIENIADLFVSLAMVPFTVSTGDTVEVTWFSYDIGGQVPIGTGIYLTKASNQWYEFDMGTINLAGGGRGFATDSVLDYSPFSKLGIYLPFIGYQELDIDECRESPINLKYRIDILSGTCVALITINGRTIYQFTGNCLTQLPLTSMDAQTMLSNAVNIGIAAASAGATAAVASAGDAMTAENLAKGDISATAAELQNAQHAASVSNAQGSLTSATANGILGMKPNFKKSGAVSASASLFNVMQPYLFLTTPRQSVPEGYERVCGFPCNMGDILGNFEGFTVVEDIRLNGLVATSPEVEEIYQLLKQGVII